MKRYFFTLIELLIVVAIIGILASILLPALKKAKDRAKDISCLGQLKQLGLVHISYAGDWDGCIPPYLNNANKTWIRIMTDNAYMPYYKANQGGRPFFSCPSYGPDSYYTQQHRVEQLTYGMGIDINMEIEGCWKITTPKVRVKNVAHPEWVERSDNYSQSEFMMFADSARLGMATNGQWYYFWNRTTKDADKVLHLRHSNKANTVFADGHVEGVDKTLAAKSGYFNYKTQKGCDETGNYY